MEHLDFEHISKTYPNGKAALKDISLTLTPGIYGLLGPNGAGKSTLMQIMTQNMAPTGGNICYQDQPIGKLGREYRRQVGFMPQQQSMLDGFTGRRFLWYMAALKGMSHRKAKQRIEYMLQIVNLTEAADRKVGGYSGGMKQRLLLAQALFDDPKILVLDEPTAGLDPRERIRIRNFISEIARDKIVLIATHVVSDIECIAKEILLLKDGELIMQGTPAQLLDSIAGKVWERRIPASALQKVEKKVCVSNVTLTGKDYRVRIVSERHYKGWICAEPTLEDVYLYYFNSKYVC